MCLRERRDQKQQLDSLWKGGPPKRIIPDEETPGPHLSCDLSPKRPEEHLTSSSLRSHLDSATLGSEHLSSGVTREGLQTRSEVLGVSASSTFSRRALTHAAPAAAARCYFYTMM